MQRPAFSAAIASTLPMKRMSRCKPLGAAWSRRADSAVSWLAYATALLGNTLMCGHFASRGEGSAVGVQVIGIANNLLILGQLAWAGAMPLAAFLAVLAIVAASLIVMRLHSGAGGGSGGGGSSNGAARRSWSRHVPFLTAVSSCMAMSHGT